MKKIIASTLMLIMLATFMSACTGGSSPTPTLSSQPTGSESGDVQNSAEVSAPVAASEINAFVGTSIFGGSLDPVKGGLSYGYSFTNCALLKVDPDSNYIGDMATDWSISEDSLVYTFELREGVKFSDGSDFTAEDVVFTYETVKANQANNENVDLTRLASVEADGDYTVVFTLSEPYSPFFDSTAMLGIVPSDAYDSADFDQYPIGTGPWKIVQYDVNQQIIIEANEDYYEGAPEIDKITLVYMDANVALSAASSGTLDIVMVGTDSTNVEIPGMYFQAFDTMDIRMLSLPVLTEQTATTPDGSEITVGNPVTSDVNVRQALSIGIDRETIIQNAMNGIGKPAYGFTDNLVWASTAQDSDNRREEAKELLESAGWVDSDGDGIRERDGVKCEFTVYCTETPRYQLAAAVAQDALELGIQINAVTATWSDVAQKQNQGAVVWGWGQYSPTVIQSLFSSEAFLVETYGNVIGFDNSLVDEQIELALSSSDHDDAIAKWKQAQTIANEEYPYLYIVNIEHTYFINDSLDISLETQIPHPHGHGSPIICNMKDWKLN